MRIFYDGKIYHMEKVGGITRYFNNIISRLPQDFQPILTSIYPRNYHDIFHPNLQLFNYKKFGFPPRILFYCLEPYYFQLVESTSKFQIFHPTYYSLLSRKKFEQKNYPVVLTVHDMIHEIFPELMDRNGQMAEIKRQAISAADIILCVSENTKKDLIERYPLLDGRVIVTHLATELTPLIGYGNEPIPSRPFFLHVGGRGLYKNFNNLLIAFSKIVSKVPDVMLCVVGKPFYTPEKSMIAEMKLDKYVQHLGNVSDSHLAKLYQNSIAFVYPSLYEGFGIPPLEAMICQAPVIASNTSSIPEVVGDAALLFNPTSTIDLADRLLFLLEHPAERERLITKGLEQAKKFSWDKTIAQTLEAYQDVAN